MSGTANKEALQLAPGTLLVGSRYSYRVLRTLGHGGFGITYECEQDDGTLVAVKEYFPNRWALRTPDMTVVPQADREKEYNTGLDRFSGEARMLTSFNHLPSVVSILDCFYGNGTSYIVMEFLDGVPLHVKMTEMGGRITPEELLPKLPPLLEDLEELHQSGVLHRDIAPDNIMWMPNNTLKLMDFGSARRMEGNQQLTVLIKPGFAPIEQYTSKGQGSYTDVYALCATVYYLITGVKPPLPFERMKSMDEQKQDNLVPPCQQGVALSPEEEQALLHGLQVQPNDRTQSMAELQLELFPPLVGHTYVDPVPFDPGIDPTEIEHYRKDTLQDPIRRKGKEPGKKKELVLPLWAAYVAGAVVVAALAAVFFLGM